MDLPQTVVDPEFPDDEFIILEDNRSEPTTANRDETPTVTPSASSVADNDDFHLYSPNQRRCSELASLANRSGVSQLVVSFEGLMSKQVGFVRKNLVRKSRDSVNFGFVSVAYGWTNSSQAATCAQEWKNVYGDRSRILLVGHSFGAGIATFKFLENIPGITVHHAITLDARTGGTDGRYLVSREFNQFSKPANEVKVQVTSEPGVPDKIQAPHDSTKSKVTGTDPEEKVCSSSRTRTPHSNSNKTKIVPSTQIVPYNPDARLPELSKDGHYIRLIYKSEPVGKMSIMEMVDLMDLAAANNQRLGISGLLFFSQQEFIQVLEGPAAEVHTLYGKILKDPRHDNARLVSLHEITERLFPAWSMKSITLSQLKPELFVKLQLKYQIKPAICQSTPKTPALLLEFLKDIYEVLVEN